MQHSAKRRTRSVSVKLVASFLGCAACGLGLPPTASAQSAPSPQAAQSAIPANTARQDKEGDRALNAGIQAYQKKQIAEASRFWEQARTIYSRDLGPNHPSTLGAMNNLAVGQNALGQNEKARELHEQILALRRAKLGEDHRDTLTSMSNLANTYCALGKDDKALTLHEQTLALRSATLGEEHPDTLDSMRFLASVCRDVGQGDRALALKNQVARSKGRPPVEDDLFSTRLGRWAIWPSPLPPRARTGRR